MLQTSDKMTALKKTELFKNLSEEALKNVAEKTIEKVIPTGVSIFNEGDEGDGMYIVVSGKVDIVKQTQKLAELKDGNFFGELALIDTGQRAASAIAAKDCILLFLDKASFQQILKTMPGVLEASMHKIMGYLRTYTDF